MATKIILPIVDESWEQHFINNGWSTIQDQIDDGYPIYAQPSNPTSVFQQVYDFVATVDTAKVDVTYLELPIDGSVTHTWTISYSLDGSTWTDFPANQMSGFASNFRYVKILIESEADDGTALTEIDNIRIKLSVKEITDGGIAVASSADANGTEVPFNKEFVDVRSITISPEHQASYPRISFSYDFADVANPTESMKVRLYDDATGNRISGNFSWQLRGI